MERMDWIKEDDAALEEFEQSGGFSRSELLKRGVATAAALAIPGVLASSGRAGTFGESFMDAGNPLNTIFGPGGKAAGQGVTINDGMMLAVTGQGSFYGRVMSRGAKLAAKQVTAAGGPAFKISIADHESGLVPPAVSGMRRLATQNHIETLQTSYGAPSEAIIPLIEQYKVLSFNGGGASPGQLNKDFLWMTRMLFGNDPAPGSLVWLYKTYKAKKLAILGTLENAVEAQKTLVPKVWPQISGGSIVAAEIHNVGETDFSAPIARIKAANPDAIWTPSFGNDLGYMVKQFRQAGVTVPIVGVEFTQQAQQIGGKLFDTFVFGGDYYDVANPNPFNVQFVKAHKKAYNVAPEFYGSNYYEHVFIIWDLIRRTLKAGGDPRKSTDLEKQLVANPTFRSVYGGSKDKVGLMTFNTKDHTISKPMGVFRVKNGQPFVVAEIKKWDGKENVNKTLVKVTGK